MNNRQVIRALKFSQYGFYSGLTHCLLAFLLYLADLGGVILFSFYLPGIFLGIFISIGLAKFNVNDRFAALSSIFWLFSGALYFTLLMMITKNIDYFLCIRRINFGGVGALTFLLLANLFYKLNSAFLHYLISYVIGIVTTLVIWSGGCEIAAYPFFIFTGIILWQTSIAFILGLSIKIEK